MFDLVGNPEAWFSRAAAHFMKMHIEFFYILTLVCALSQACVTLALSSLDSVS